jgi:hypothetical protein
MLTTTTKTTNTNLKKTLKTNKWGPHTWVELWQEGALVSSRFHVLAHRVLLCLEVRLLRRNISDVRCKPRVSGRRGMLILFLWHPEENDRDPTRHDNKSELFGLQPGGK